jgi:hypothetical protein
MIQEVEKFLLPWFITNVVSLMVVYVCFKWKKAGRYLFGVIFLLAAAVNAWMGIFQPSAYLDYGKLTFLTIYKAFIYGFFAENTTLLVLLVALGQLAISIGMFLNKKLLAPAIAGAAIFLLAIVPLGVGSAFPASLFLVGGLWLLARRQEVAPGQP